MIEHSPSIVDLIKGLHGAQATLTGVVKDRKNPHFKNNYATLEAVLDTARPALQANGLAITQAPGRVVEGCIEITTMLMHTSGEWMRSTLHVPLVKRDPQGLGSATTYGLRYALMAALGVPPTDDDDGNAAGNDQRQQSGKAKIEVAPAGQESGSAKGRYIDNCRTHIRHQSDAVKLREWWQNEKQARRDFELDQDEVDSLKTAFSDRLQAIAPQAGDQAEPRTNGHQQHRNGARTQ